MKTPLSLLVAALVLAAAALAAAQDQTFVQQAQKQDLVDVQFFADANFQMVHTPWAYYDFQPIQVGACTACTDFQNAPVTWGSAMVAYSPTGGELLHMFSGPGCTGTPLNTGGSAPTLPASYSATSFMICRTSS